MFLKEHIKIFYDVEIIYFFKNIYIFYHRFVHISHRFFDYNRSTKMKIINIQKEIAENPARRRLAIIE